MESKDPREKRREELRVALTTITDDKVVTELQRSAELRLSAQLQAAIAADQRAIALFGVVLALVSFFLGAAIAAQTADEPQFVVARICLTASAGFFFAGVCAFLASRPIPFKFAGNEPRSWATDLSTQVSFLDSLKSQVVHYDRFLDRNSDAMERSASYLFGACVIAAFCVVACGGWAVVWLVAPSPA